MPIKSQILLSLRGGASFPFPWVGNGFRDLLLIHRLWQRWWYVTFGIRLPKIATSVLNMVSFSWVSYLEEASCHVRRIQINLQRGSRGEELSSLVNRQQKSSQSPPPSRDGVWGGVWWVYGDSELHGLCSSHLPVVVAMNHPSWGESILMYLCPLPLTVCFYLYGLHLFMIQPSLSNPSYFVETDFGFLSSEEWVFF